MSILIIYLKALTICSENTKYLVVLAHHKSGTMESQHVYQWLCIKQFYQDKTPLCPYVELEMHGLLNNTQYKNSNISVLHFIRHPVDMVLSGMILR